MNIVINLVLGLQILTALAMIGLVLLQHGKGADMGASFGSGASGSLFGATGSANFLSRSTAACAAVFFVSTLVLAYSANERPRASTGSSVLDRPNAASAAAPSSSGALAIPGVASAVVVPLATPAAPATGGAPAGASGAAAIPQK
ncbi:MAG: preprotein translocase subunit SecG [Rhizobacter sp.]|nr:preprotein translocase subunit SecG [Rhizobacter sp.]